MFQFGNHKIVWAKLPSTGLGNKLSVWARAYVYARLNQLPLVTSGWLKFRLGPFIRLERSKRFYFNYFKHDSYLDHAKVLILKILGNIQSNPELHEKIYDRECIIFSRYYMDFSDIAPFRKEIIDGLFESLHDSVRKQLPGLGSPAIAVHIRRGDFKRGSFLTPLSYYITIVKSLRLISGNETPVTVYSDAEDGEIESILRLPFVQRASVKSDILDLLEMSRSKILITAARSTFSYWACFIGNGIAIKNDAEWFPYLRSANKGASQDEWVIGESVNFTREQSEKIRCILSK